MASLGSYQKLSSAYNTTGTITYQIPEQVKDGSNLVINETGMQLVMDVSGGEVSKITFKVDSAEDGRYPGTFQGFEFGMGWQHPSFIHAFIEAKNHPGQIYEGDNGFAHYTGLVSSENNSLEVTLTPSK